MTIYYGSFAYFIPIIIICGAVAGLYFALRRRSEFVKKLVLIILMLINIIQHILKQFIWPHYWGNSYPDLINGAYNMCATLILISPFVFISKSRVFKQFLAYVGTAAGLLTMAVPHWYIGQTLWQWDVLRYYFCHGVLFATSLLPALWGMYKFNWRDFYKFPLIFFALLMLIAFNDLVFYALGLIGAGEDFFTVLYNNNPCWMMHPDDGFTFLIPVIDFFTPDVFFPDGADGTYTPILWYAIPVFLMFCILGVALGALLDRRRFVSDMKAVGRTARLLWSKIAGLTRRLFRSDKASAQTPAAADEVSGGTCGSVGSAESGAEGSSPSLPEEAAAEQNSPTAEGDNDEQSSANGTDGQPE